MSAVEASRRRHPSSRSPVPEHRVAAGVARLLDRSGVGQPRVAACVLQLRGRSGLSPDGFAGRLAIGADVVRRAEAGELALDQLPEPLRRQVRTLLLEAEARWSI